MVGNRFESPDRGPRGRLQNLLANSVGLARLRRAVFSRLPFPVLASDVRDVVYASWSRRWPASRTKSHRTWRC